MEFLPFCLEVINREVKKFNVSFDVSGIKTLTIASANNANYDLVKKRNHFLYRCGTINLNLAKVCFKTFLLDKEVSENLFSRWKSYADLTFCSVSSGPAIDYIAFLYSFLESGLVPPLFKNIKLVTKYGAWRNTINIMHEIIAGGFLKSLPLTTFEKVNVIQGDPFKEFAKKIKSSISSSDVIMMMQRLNLQVGAYNPQKISKSIQVFLDALKPGAVLFCIDNKRSVKEMTPLLNSFSGKFLLKPTTINAIINFDFSNVIKNHVGCLPVVEAQGVFFVWEKSLSESFKLKSNTNDITNKICNNEIPKLGTVAQGNIAESANGCLKNLYCLPSTSGLATACTQTEPENLLLETEAKRVTELTRRIEKLTAELAELLENNESQNCTNGQHLKKTFDTCNNMFLDDGINDHCSSAISCSNLSGGIQNSETCCCCQYHTHSQCCLVSGCAKIKETNASEAFNFNNPPIKHNTILSAESNLPSAQLVIPLTNLSADVVSQIISLLCQPKETNRVSDQKSE